MEEVNEKVVVDPVLDQQRESISEENGVGNTEDIKVEKKNKRSSVPLEKMFDVEDVQNISPHSGRNSPNKKGMSISIFRLLPIK